jgi:2-polyprenyl-3-methyl-5-hydroxy-6-metoxy-1,4-benzoquinol methylase
LLCLWAFYTAGLKNNSSVNVVYSAEGLLGQITVIDYQRPGSDLVNKDHVRWLYVNRISQTMYDSLADESKNEEKYFTYVYRISDYLDSFPKGAKVLLLGLGGGSIAKHLTEKGFSVDICELDTRIAMVARNYFYLSDKVSITVDDARHYIKTCKKKYDIIVLDMFKGEDMPNHVFTVESLEEIKKMLAANGTVFVNGHGYIDGNIGKAMRSIHKTFTAADFHVEVLPTHPNPDIRNLLFYASLTEINTNKDFIPRSELNLADAVVLTDEYPVLDMLNAEAAKRWRTMAMNSFAPGTIPFFK